MLLVVGLGNPDRKYAGNRHNVGFMVLDDLASEVRAEPFQRKFSGELARATLGKTEALLLKPQTYMNLSGDSVQPCAAFFKIAAADVVVVHDEIDLPFGEVRLKFGGGHAGNNGVRSLIARLGTPEFARVRVGVGRPGPGFKGEVADWVLQDFSGEERAALPNSLMAAVQSVLDIAARGFQAAANARNTRPKKKPSEDSPPKPEKTERS
ncbi:MAG: aminoacyl-tRNA hydrolase [Deltaproteobacteria bacterium]|nr:aminoacyl-tRNA hydrolase [Deltaproteobacteria bacterium]